MEMGGVVSGAGQSRRGLGDSDGDESAVVVRGYVPVGCRDVPARLLGRLSVL